MSRFKIGNKIKVVNRASINDPYSNGDIGIVVKGGCALFINFNGQNNETIKGDGICFVFPHEVELMPSEDLEEKPVNSKSVVVCAACKHNDLILCGARHWDKIMNKQLDTLKHAGCSLFSGDFTQGFIDQFGTFLTREEAMKVAVAAGQEVDIERGCGGDKDTLYSEGLY